MAIFNGIDKIFTIGSRGFFLEILYWTMRLFGQGRWEAARGIIQLTDKYQQGNAFKRMRILEALAKLKLMFSNNTNPSQDKIFEKALEIYLSDRNGHEVENFLDMLLKKTNNKNVRLDAKLSLIENSLNLIYTCSLYKNVNIKEEVAKQEFPELFNSLLQAEVEFLHVSGATVPKHLVESLTSQAALSSSSFGSPGQKSSHLVESLTSKAASSLSNLGSPGPQSSHLVESLTSKSASSSSNFGSPGQQSSHVRGQTVIYAYSSFTATTATQQQQQFYHQERAVAVLQDGTINNSTLKLSIRN